MRYSAVCLSLLFIVPIYSLSDDSLSSMVESAKNSVKNFYNRISISIWAYQNPLTGNTVLTGSIGYQSATRPIDVWRGWAQELYENYKNLFKYHASKMIKFFHEHPKLFVFASSQVILLYELHIWITIHGICFIGIGGRCIWHERRQAFSISHYLC